MVKIATTLTHAGTDKNEVYGAITTPIYLSTTYQHPEFGKSTGYDYTRTKNPTRAALENTLAKIEKGSVALALSAGMSAIDLVLSSLPVGSSIIASRDLYGGTFRLLNYYNDRGQLKVLFGDNESDFGKLVEQNNDVKAIFLETPSNPLMNEIDITKVSTLAHKIGAVVIVDNTFYTPIIQQPLTLGADIVVHSATKYLSGHNDVLAGVVVAKDEKIGKKLEVNLNMTGQVLSPFDSWLLLRGLKTLPLRIKQHEKNAKEIVNFLKKQSSITKVYYTGRGGMVSFKVTDENKIGDFLNHLNLISYAESLGGVESLITYPATQTHADISREVRYSYGLTDDLLRISVGIEDVEDLINDLKNALQVFEK
ncbi:MAG: aminotransferase class I/II-fold pyridoxal phosphate-dependent enzyme [Candidatus Ancillula sp.]|jgi:cystathionine gamma-synthase|nr:aminotransferase class I/II-fold pyridoxal phosphate-dependent enzyme [Candidatus Ancillula sp.]